MKPDEVLGAMLDACRAFGGTDGMFNAAGFGIAIMKRAGLKGVVDGMLVRTILRGRPDVEQMPDGSHFRLLDTAAASNRREPLSDLDDDHAQVVSALVIAIKRARTWHQIKEAADAIVMVEICRYRPMRRDLERLGSEGEPSSLSGLGRSPVAQEGKTP